MSAGTERFSIVIEPAGLRYEAASDISILESARKAGVMLRSSCRNGTCRACICRLRTGRVRHAIEWPGLSAEEKAEGWILPCVALPLEASTLEQVEVREAREVRPQPAQTITSRCSAGSEGG